MSRLSLLPWLLFAHVAAGDVLCEQTEPLHLSGASEPVIIHAEPKQTEATPIRISGWIKSRGVTGPPGRDFLIVTNLTYETTSVFWDTLIFPQRGTQPWRYYERVIRARLPIQEVDLKFVFKCEGEAWFRDFKVETIEPWEENPEAVVVMLGDSTDMISYLPRELGTSYLLEALVRDRFHEHDVQVRNLAESGDWLGKLLGTGRLDRELATLPRCDVIVIRYGLNDEKRTEPPQFKQQLAEVCDRVLAKFPDAQIILSTTLPPREVKYEPVVRELAAERGLPIMEVGRHFRDLAKRGVWHWRRGTGKDIGYDTHGDVEHKARALKGDIHPNAFGCRLMAELLFHTVEPHLAKRLQ